MKTAQQVYELAQERGLHFRLIAPGELEVSGPQRELHNLEEVLGHYRHGLTALAEEFHTPVAIAESILAAATARPNGKRPKTLRLKSSEQRPLKAISD